MKYFPVLVLCLLLVVGCKKDKPAPQLAIPEVKGMVKGKVLPVNSALEVTLIGFIEDKLLNLSAKPDDQGNFTFSNLNSGNYSVVVSQNGGFERPRDTTIQVLTNHTVELPTITLTKTPEPPFPNPAMGSIVGKISPAGAATEVNLLNTNGWKKIDFDPKTGIFSAENLSEGNYLVSVSSDWKFIGPSAISVEVKAKTKSDVGIIAFTPNDKLQSLSFNLGVKNVALNMYIRNPVFTYLNTTFKESKLVISGGSSSGNREFLSGNRSTQITIRLKDVTGPGTYLCDGTEDSKINYSESFSAPLVSRSTKLINTANTKVIITTFDPVAKKIVGTFSGTLRDSSGNGGSDQQVTNGVFDVKYE